MCTRNCGSQSHSYYLLFRYCLRSTSSSLFVFSNATTTLQLFYFLTASILLYHHAALIDQKGCCLQYSYNIHPTLAEGESPQASVTIVVGDICLLYTTLKTLTKRHTFSFNKCLTILHQDAFHQKRHVATNGYCRMFKHHTFQKLWKGPK